MRRFLVGGKGVEGGALADVFVPAGEGFVEGLGFLEGEGASKDSEGRSKPSDLKSKISDIRGP